MHKYLEFAKDYFETRGIIISEDLGENKFKFFFKEINFEFCLDSFFPHSLPIITATDIKNNYPHFIGNNLVWLCLGREEDFNLYDSPGEEIIENVIDSFFELLDLSPSQQNKEFSKEFLHYWHKKRKDNIVFKMYLQEDEKTSEIFINEYLKNDYNAPQKTNKKIKKIGKPHIGIVSLKENDINHYSKKNGTLKKGLLIPLENGVQLTPFPEEWDFNYIINQCISENTFLFLKNYIVEKEYIYIVFSMFLDNGFKIQFSGLIEFSTSKKDTFLNKLKNEYVLIEPILSKRFSRDYLCKRTSGNSDMTSKNISVIGCGSLGSYIVNEIAKLGIKSLNIYDPDKLEPENIFRHILGEEYLFHNKAKALEVNLSINFSSLNIKAFEEKINWKTIEKLNFDNTDLLIFSIGSTTDQLLINDKLREIKFIKPVLFTWLDSFGSGCHALLVDYSKKGCYKCLSKFNVSFSKNNNDIVQTDGCGGTFTPYGNSILLKGTSMILDIVTQLFSNREFHKNPLFSIKNIKQNNIEYTNRYLKNNDDLFEVYDYIDERCDCCGN
ncbi:MAG: ThiF family adenylyltransferase [Fusobacteriaceae bacterium]|nr:ThiF family adenylyltransferase [Fusobacteriaceae bacterium]